MFQFPRFPTYSYWFTVCSMILHHGCSHIRKSADRSLFAAPRSLSQLVTSFVGSQCQGILHMLFFAWTTFCISGDILSVLVFSRLNCCVSYLQFKTFYRLWQNCFLLPFTEKPDFILQILLCGLWFPVSLYFVCHVCHIHSKKESICHFSYSVFNEHSF